MIKITSLIFDKFYTACETCGLNLNNQMKLNDNTFNMLSGITTDYSHAKSDIVNKNNAINKGPHVSFTGGVQSLRDEALSVASDVIERERDVWRQAFADELARRQAPKTFGEISRSLFTSARDFAVKFVKNNITEGCDITYDNYETVKKELAANFGTTFQECKDNVLDYNNSISTPKHDLITDFIHKTFHIPRGKKDKFVYVIDEDRDMITFHKDPFVKNVCFNIKEFIVGNLLDAGVGIRGFCRRANAKFTTGEIIDPRGQRFEKFNKLLDNRIAEVKARDSYYRIMGVFESAFEGVDAIKERQIVPGSANLVDDIQIQIVDNIRSLSKNSLNAAMKKSGNYNTKTERAMNRLGTGFVSAMFAATDFYNISMLQNNDKKKAEKAQHKRFAQDMRRQGLTAGITYIVLGSLQKNVNKSVLAAVLSLGGVTLISEVLSRKMGGISLVPLSPEKARKEAEKNKTGSLGDSDKTKTNNNVLPVSLADVSPKENISQNPRYKVYKVFTDKIEYTPPPKPNKKGKTAFTSNGTEKADNKKQKSNILHYTKKIIGGAIGASLAIGFLRSRNAFHIDDVFKSIGAKYNDLIEVATRKRLIMAKDDVDGFLRYLNTGHFREQYLTLNEALSDITKHGALSGQSAVVQKYLPKKEINPEGLYYDLGYVQSKAKKTACDFITYPINFVAKLAKNTNNLIRNIICGRPEEAVKEGVTRQQAIEFMEKYAQKYRDALVKGERYSFDQEIKQAFTKHLSEANSVNKNTTVAMLSRFLITFITGYFFVNDYRNQVLIESKGEDIEGANATMKERIGHKAANFFLNSMFMDFFNTTFERAYLSSVFGATAVAMATEFTNETAVRASICTPTDKMNRDELIAYEKERLEDDGIKGKYYRAFMRLTGKKPLSEKAKKN